MQILLRMMSGACFAFGMFCIVLATNSKVKAINSVVFVITGMVFIAVSFGLF